MAPWPKLPPSWPIKIPQKRNKSLFLFLFFILIFFDSSASLLPPGRNKIVSHLKCQLRQLQHSSVNSSFNFAVSSPQNIYHEQWLPVPWPGLLPVSYPSRRLPSLGGRLLRLQALVQPWSLPAELPLPPRSRSKSGVSRPSTLPAPRRPSTVSLFPGSS